jgi:hypothetical protein
MDSVERASARKCLARFKMRALPMADLAAFAKLYVLAGQLPEAQKVVDHWIRSTRTPTAKAEAISYAIGVVPSGQQTVDLYRSNVARLDSLGEDALPYLPSHYLAGGRLFPEDSSVARLHWFRNAITLGERLRSRRGKSAPLDLLADSYIQAINAHQFAGEFELAAALADSGIRSIGDGEGTPSRRLRGYRTLGKRGRPIRATYWYNVPNPFPGMYVPGRRRISVVEMTEYG